ncbi:MAG TPA: DUF4870 domain-containing protein [Firmicutes bacterium]|nr:DUF4870 domain-containing protein [Bacillota bacterium]
MDKLLPLSQEEKTFGMLVHLSALAGYFIPAGNIFGPLIVWLIKKDQLPYVDQQGKEAINFQISILIYAVVSAVLILVLIGVVLLIVVGLFNLIYIVIASVKANNGEDFRYPLTIRFIK